MYGTSYESIDKDMMMRLYMAGFIKDQRKYY
jgi:hypothetical protein